MRGTDWEHRSDPGTDGRPLGYRRWADLIRAGNAETAAFPVITRPCAIGEVTTGGTRDVGRSAPCADA